MENVFRLRSHSLGLRALFVLLVVGLLAATPGRATDKQVLYGHVPAAASRQTPLGRLQSSQHLSLAISLPLRNQQALTDLLRQISDPSSPNYRHYLTAQQFAARFGPTQSDYQAVIDFAKAQGLKVTATHPNRTILDVEGNVPNIEKAFHITMWNYQHPAEARRFYAPSTDPSINLNVPILSISGLNNYSLPHPRYRLSNVTTKAYLSAPNAGSAPNGGYMGNDFRTAYVPGVALTGAGQSVGLLQFDGYTTSDITYYENLTGRSNITLSNVLLDGFSGAPTGSGGEVEVSLDIEMAISMAPGLSNIVVYEAGPTGNWHDILNRMATDNLAKQLSCSWYIPNGAADTTADQIFQQMAAQGQSFFSASGDYDAFTGLIPFPGDTPYITEVGGTTLTASGVDGSYGSETVWNRNNGVGSGGGISTQYAIPTWQQGINMGSNLGSTTMRNVPDVALTAENVYVRANGADQSVGGTSCAAPLWAAFTALVNQQAVANSGTTVGFINPTVYALGQGAAYNTVFHDTTTGNNFSSSSPAKFPAATGYDLCTGWGTPTGSALINALAGALGPAISTSNPLPSGVIGTAYSQALTATGGAPPYAWAISSGSLPAGLSLSSAGVVSGIPTATGTASFNVRVSDANNASSTTAFSMTIYAQGTPIIATTSPLPTGTVGAAYNQVLAANGGTTPYTWSLSSGALPLGLSLNGGGVISGLPTATGTSTFTLQVTDNNGLSSTSPFAMTVNPAPTPPTIATTSPLAAGVVGIAYSRTLTANGGTAPYTWSIASGSLPPGLTLSSGGTISGTPTFALTANFTVQVTGGNSLYSTTAFSLTINPVGALANGSFETGSFSNWITSDISSPFVALQVRTNGYSPGFGLFSNTATDGSYSATSGFDGIVPGTIQIAQDISVSPSNPYVAFDYRAGWDMLDYAGSTLARTFTVTVQPSGGGSTLLTSTLLTAQPNTKTLDTGALSGSVNLSAYAGTNIRVCFNLYVPQSHTGPGYFELDNVRMAAAVPPVITTSSPLASGTVGTSYVLSLKVSGGVSPYTWSINSGSLPAGLNLSPSGVINGTPTTDGTASFTAEVTDGNGVSATKAFALTITVPAPVITGTLSASGTVGVPFNYQITATNSPTSFGASGLPAGLSVNTTTGLISGTPTSGGLTNVTISASNGATGSAVLALTVQQPPSFTNGPPPAATINVAYNFTYAFSGYPAPTFSITSGTMPTGLGFSTSGVISGTPTAVGTFTGTVTASNGIGTPASQNFSIVVQQAPAITDGPPPTSAPLNTPYSFTYTFIGYPSPTFSVTSGNLPTGLILSSAGILSGTPTQVGTYTGTVSASNSKATANQNFTISVQGLQAPSFANGPPPATATANSRYLFTYNVAGFPSPTISLTTGSLPPGLSLSVAGTISGTPTQTGTFTGTVTATNNLGSATQDFSISIFNNLVQRYTILHNFRDGTTTNDGFVPRGTLVQGADGNLYGTTYYGGSINSYGTIVKITPQGTETLVHGFGDGSVQSDGKYPYAGLFKASDGNFYGTTSNGGSTNNGAVYKMAPAGTVTTLYSFYNYTTGDAPFAAVIQGTDKNLYGTTTTGGTADVGCIFAMTLQGAITILHSFKDGSVASDGSTPQTALVQGSDGNFYGTTGTGGSAGQGIVYRITPQGTLTILHSFADGTVSNDGKSPQASLIQATDGNFYGTTSAGGSAGYGTIFEMTPQGVVTILHSFGDGSIPGDAKISEAALLQASDGNFYGTSNAGGAGAYGTVFRMTTSGVVTILHSFADGTVSNDGQYTVTGLVQGSDGNLYGMTTNGGTASNGTIFKIGLATPSPIAPVFNNTPLAAVTSVNVPFGFTYLTNGYPVPSLTVTSGGLPPGLTLSSAGVISGTPTSTGTFTGTVTASNGIGTAASQTFSIIVQQPPTITNGPPLAATTNTPYSFSYTSTGYPAPTFSVTSGALPAGLSLSSAGVISGTPITAGTATGVVTASNGVSPNATQAFSIQVTGPPVTSPVITAEPPFIIGNSNTVTWSSVAGAIQYDVQASTTSAFSTVTDSGWITATSFTFSGLAAGTTYYYRVRARSGSGPDGMWTQASQPDFNADVFTSTMDGPGNLYVSDANNDTVRKITPTGIVTTFAGTAGVLGTADGTGAAALFGYPEGMVIDANGNIYVADAYYHTIRKITPGGVVTTVAGLAGNTGTSDGTGTAARLNSPTGMAIDASGTIYIADRYNHTIRKMTPNGAVTTWVGLGGTVGSADGTGTAARFNGPTALTIDSSGNVFVTDTSNSTIRKITPAGIVTTLAGLALSYASADGIGSAARFNNPSGISADESGNLYISDYGNNTIRKCTPGGNVTTLAGSANASGSSDGTGSVARFFHPFGLEVNGNGLIYMSDSSNQTIRQFTSGGVVTTLAGKATIAGTTDGTNSNSRFHGPSAVGLDLSGGIILSQSGSAYSSTGTLVSTSIAPSPLIGWGILSFAANVAPIGTSVTVDVLGSGGSVLASNVSSGTDLNTLPSVAGLTSISLRANFATTNSANTATLSNWSVSYYSNTLSMWSTPISSTQGLAPVIAGGPLSTTILVNSAYNFSYTASGFPAPSFSVTAGALPTGLTLSSTGFISGTPTATGTYTGTVTATNGVGTDVTQNFSISVQQSPAITNGPPPDGEINADYSFAYTSNGYPKPTFYLTSGALPNGLSLSSAGVISGTPAMVGTYTGTVTATNGIGTDSTQSFTINITTPTARPATDTPVMPPWGLAILAMLLMTIAYKKIPKPQPSPH